MRLAKFGALLLFGVAALFGIALAINPADQNSSPDSVVGYVRHSECVYRFHEVLKPLPNGCVEACVRGGASLVILARQEPGLPSHFSRNACQGDPLKAASVRRQARQGFWHDL